MTDRESFANKLTGTIFDIKNFAQSVLISERPPALQAASQTQQDWENWNPTYEDPIHILNNPNLISEERYDDQQEAGKNGLKLPTRGFLANQDYILYSAISDGQVLLKQGEGLPPQRLQQYYTSIENKQQLAGREYQDLILLGQRRELKRQDVGFARQIHVPIDALRARPPLISPDTNHVTVPKRVQNEIFQTPYEIGHYYVNEPAVEQMLTPDVFLPSTRMDMERRRLQNLENVDRVISMRQKMAVYKQRKAEAK